ncbi:uncharacterized protein LOC131649900 [Vicia villosa]|uniref:uncharacterized protein LOC131649900 n=1 Tax=Vicia villosa TaxID=3911 RepID=UPI00273ABED4|nr:uncharacterized protein LOC131649900 [Vicia villosa]
MTKGYKAIIGESNAVDWYHMLCHSIARPRAKMILWLAIQDRLPTKYKLYKLGMIQHQRCELCDGEDESLDHLLFRCPQTVRIWNDLLHWLDIKDTYSLNFDWMKKITKGKGIKRSILKAVSTEVVSSIWMYRNHKTFGNMGLYSNTDSIITHIQDIIVYRGWMKSTYRKHIANLIM